MGAGLWLASPLSKPSTQTTISSLFGMVPARLEPLTGLLSLVRYLRVVSWSIGKAGSGSRDGLCGHRVKDVPVTYICHRHGCLARLSLDSLFISLSPTLHPHSLILSFFLSYLFT